MNNDSGNKKIAKNTIVVYLELFFTLATNLISTRLILQVLGAADYGLYNVVGGIVVMFSFISSSLERTTIRFLNYEMGKQNGNVNVIFNQSILIHFVFSVLIFILLETIGIFYITNYLNVDAGKEADAMFVFQISTIATCFAISNIPYQSVFVAHEKFLSIAIINISKIVVRLCLIIYLLYYNGNTLRFYAVGMGITTVLSPIIYHMWSSQRWPSVVRWKIVKNWNSYKEQLFFSNWNLLKSASMVARQQGAAILINIFFSTIVNAAYSISYTVQLQVAHFVGKFDAAVAPQITKSIGAGNVDRAVFLASHTCRICVLLMEIAFWGLYVELEFILNLWLGGNIPEDTITFCKYTLLIALVSSTCGGQVQLINGFGKLKWFMLSMSFCYFLSLIVSFVLFKYSYPPYTIVIMFVLSDLVYRMTEYYFLRRLFSINIKKFLKDAYFRPFLVFLLMIVFFMIYPFFHFESFCEKFFGIVLTISIVISLSIFIGIDKTERGRVWDLVLQRIKQ